MRCLCMSNESRSWRMSVTDCPDRITNTTPSLQMPNIHIPGQGVPAPLLDLWYLCNVRDITHCGATSWHPGLRGVIWQYLHNICSLVRTMANIINRPQGEPRGQCRGAAKRLAHWISAAVISSSSSFRIWPPRNIPATLWSGAAVRRRDWT